MTAPMRALALAPLSVSPERQRAGMGGALIREGLQQSGMLGWEAVFVLGDPLYYGRFGFGADTARGFESPYAGPHLMVYALKMPLPTRSGRIDHAPAFSALG